MRGRFGQEIDKEGAKKAIKSFKINNTLLEKKVADLDEKEFKQVVTIVKRMGI